ncbi:MAG: enoyl-CoA hydratase/isomerase family protein [Ktedonobacteraceae bacterium]|nr:enoyl-CoA hydratase/isomerase family protein [Ktedonobacteraceae bacterium]
MPTYTYIRVEYSFERKIATVTLQRPEVHNAMNAQVIEELMKAFLELSSDEHLHAVVLTGDGPSFSAGGDINAMREAANFTEEQNLNDALHLADLLHIINTFPCPVVARVNGTAMGGGVGLVAVCDIAIAAENTRFAFSEVKLGIVPAVISPYILRKIGESHARMLFATGERFSAAHAHEIGLVHSFVAREQLDEAVQKVLKELLTSGPQAIRACKALALNVVKMGREEARIYTAQTLARLRVSDEGQEGLQAFLEKRKPHWIA